MSVRVHILFYSTSALVSYPEIVSYILAEDMNIQIKKKKMSLLMAQEST